MGYMGYIIREYFECLTLIPTELQRSLLAPIAADTNMFWTGLVISWGTLLLVKSILPMHPVLLSTYANLSRDQSTGPRLEYYKETAFVKNRKSSIPLKYTAEASVPTPYSILREV